MYAGGAGFRQVACQLKVSHVSVMNWVKAFASQLPNEPIPDEVDPVKMDEMYTFTGENASAEKKIIFYSLEMCYNALEGF